MTIWFIPKNDFYYDSYYQEYDHSFLLKLALTFENNEGSTFYGHLDQQKIQLEFHKKCFLEINPKNILEIGTHKANYSYFAKKNCPEVKIVTFGIDPESEKCVNLVQEYFSEDFIEFHCGNSIDTLTNYNTTLKFDIAWVDGGHDFSCAYSDLNNCVRLGIKNILVDDVNDHRVLYAIEEFLIKNQDYRIKDKSEDERKIYWLTC